MVNFNRAALRRAFTGFSALFMAAFALVKPKWEDYATRIDSKDLEEDLVLPEGMGELYARDGGAPKRPAVIYTYTITNKDKVNWTEVPKSAFELDKLKAYDTQMQLMGRNSAGFGDQVVFDLLVGGFTATGPDGVAFFSASHPVDSGVQSNLQTGALSETTYGAALTKLQSMTDYYGRPLSLAADEEKVPLLVVGPSNREMANRLINGQLAEDGSSNPNFKSAKVVVNPRLIGDYAAYWFLVWPDEYVRPFAIAVVKQPELHMVMSPEDKDVRDRNVVPCWVEAMYGGGYAFYQLCIGSPGV